MKRTLLFLMPVFLIISCRPNKTVERSDLAGSWRLYEIVPTESKDNSLEVQAELQSTAAKGLILNIFNDSTYSDIEGSGSFTTGKWDYSPGDRLLKLSGSFVGVAELGKGKNDKQTLDLKLINEKMIMKFIKDGDALKICRDDPFHAANNVWRIKFNSNEDSLQLRKRMANYFKHLVLILKASQERKQNVVSFEYSQGPVKIYSGGIGILPYEQVSEKWKNTFYGEENSLSAYNMFRNYLRTNKYHGAGTGDWVEDDKNILLSIYSGFN